MTEARLAPSELLEKGGDGEFLRTVAEAVLQLLMVLSRLASFATHRAA
jgi:hypothetical protein